MDDKTIEKLASNLNIWKNISSLIPGLFGVIAALYGYFTNKEDIKGLFWVVVGCLLSVLLLWAGHRLAAAIVVSVRNMHLKVAQAEAELEAEKGMSFDYKMSAPLESNSTLSLMQRYGWNIDDVGDNEVRMVDSGDEKYLPLLDFFKIGLDDFSALPVRNDEKWGRCIIQVSFIPVDKDGNIPLILRMPYSHSRDVTVLSAGLEPARAKFTFVSFSPVPQKYGKNFDLRTCYEREVPNRPVGSGATFEELGCSFKFETRNGKKRIYVFYVVLVRYADALFLNSDGMLHKEVVNGLFAVNPEASDEEVMYFLKDHDRILTAAKASEIYNALSKDGDREKLPERLSNLFSQTDYVIRTKNRKSDVSSARIEHHFDMTRGSLGAIELSYIQYLRTRS